MTCAGHSQLFFPTFCKPKSRQKACLLGTPADSQFKSATTAKLTPVRRTGLKQVPVGFTRFIIGRYSRPRTARSASEKGYALLYFAYAHVTPFSNMHSKILRIPLALSQFIGDLGHTDAKSGSQ
jgi:hypothetical protein